MRKITEGIQLAGYDELFKMTQEDLAVSSGTQVVEIPIEQLHEFKNHPFKVLDDEEMDELVESVKEVGVFEPVKVRVRPEGGYELIAGHRRKHACEIAKIKKLPAIIYDFDDAEATIRMVDSNIQRKHLLISEKAKSYAMKYHAQKSQGQGQAKGTMLQKMSEEYKESEKQVQRFVWLARLIPGLLDLMDEEKLGFTQGVDFSFLNEEQQLCVLLVIQMGGIKVSTKQSAEIKRLAMENPSGFTVDIVQKILAKKEVFERKLSFTEKKLSKYFDKSYSNKDIEELIIRLLEEWKESNDGGTQK